MVNSWRCSGGGDDGGGGGGDGGGSGIRASAKAATTENAFTQFNESRGGARAARATLVSRHVNATTWSSA